MRYTTDEDRGRVERDRFRGGRHGRGGRYGNDGHDPEFRDGRDGFGHHGRGPGFGRNDLRHALLSLVSGHGAAWRGTPELRMGGRGHGHSHGRGHGDSFGSEGRGGRDGFGRGGRGVGRVFGSGDLRLVLLSLIGDQPRHGYELIKAVEDLFGGAYAPSPGSVYPILTLLEELGHIRAAASEGAKKLFEITDQGRSFLAENRTLLDAILSRMGLAAHSMAGSRPPEEVYQAFQTLKTAVVLHTRGWASDEVARVRRIIEAAAREIATGGRDE